MHVDPTPEQFQEFKDLPRDMPVHMLNLIKLKALASYTDGRESTGAEAYANYGKASGRIFTNVGGQIIWRGKPESVLIGPKEEHWDIAFIARYPNAAAFLQMVTDPEYQSIVFHRQAAVETSRLIRMAELDSNGRFDE